MSSEFSAVKAAVGCWLRHPAASISSIDKLSSGSSAPETDPCVSFSQLPCNACLPNNFLGRACIRSPNTRPPSTSVNHLDSTAQHIDYIDKNNNTSQPPGEGRVLTPNRSKTTLPSISHLQFRSFLSAYGPYSNPLEALS